MMPTPSIIDFVTDPQLLGLSLSEPQETLLRAIYGLPMSSAQLECFRLCTGRERPHPGGWGEVAVVAGARAGKDSRIAAPIVCYEALFGGHEHHLAKGERGVLPLVAQDARGTKVAFGYVKDYLLGSPLLAQQVAGDPLANEITLTNGLSVACFPSTLRSLRGWSIPAGVLDELAFFRLEGSADSDSEIQASVRRGMLSFPAPRLVKVSTPYMKSGVLYEDFKRAWAQNDPDLLVWRASSALMNPSLKPGRLERERRLDPSRFGREYEAEFFAEDLDSFLPAAWVEAAVMRGRYELPPQPGVKYWAAADPSGGGPDHFTLSILHMEGRGPERRVVQDVMRGWGRKGSEAPDLAGVVRECATLLPRYGLKAVVGDRYAAAWVRQAFRSAGITYLDSTMDRSTAYIEVEPLFAQGQVSILDHPQLVRELKHLEKRPRPGGKTLVDHPSGSAYHDDHANSFALAAALAVRTMRSGSPRALVFADATVELAEPALQGPRRQDPRRQAF